MTPTRLITDAIRPALALLPPKMASMKAEAMILSICLQETELKTRFQYKGGPARGFPQFEKIGVRGVLEHRMSKVLARHVCARLGVPPQVNAIHAAMGTDDVLGMAFARLNLWTSPRPLYEATDIDAAWFLYLAVWRPGKPRPEKWESSWIRAWDAVWDTP